MLRDVNAVHLRPTDRAANAWFGDPVPFYWDGTYHLFYVWDQDHLVLPRVCHSWGHLASKDLVHWQEYPMCIEPGEEASCGTGSIFHANGIFHLYYLGRYFTTNGVMHETMCHATSTDLVTWTKDPANPFSRPDPKYYADADWRDGYPFWNDEAGEYWMLVTASMKDGPEPRRGAIALLASKDLENWESRGPYWAPGLGRHLECPDLFFLNGWWYLLVSGSFGHQAGTIYRRSRSMNGPWESCEIDTFDSPLFYAAKTASDGKRRMLFGWVGTREGDVDTGRVQWGGHGLVREIVQHDDGTLWVRCPPERLQLGTPLPGLMLTPRLGQWTVENGHVTAERTHGFSYATAPAPRNALLRCTFTPDGTTHRFGLLLRTDQDMTNGYQVTVDPVKQHIVITSYKPDRQPRPAPLVRPFPVKPGEPVTLTAFFSGSILEVFANDTTALTARLYEHKGECMGLFVEEGAGSFSDINLRELPAETW
ncbi:MAG TPA: glycoside hydrolase family 32 protein [Deinococcales bacterium]|nr:glycoside hydrolase family 32 protein [Deinococcales bacterium]